MKFERIVCIQKHIQNHIHHSFDETHHFFEGIHHSLFKSQPLKTHSKLSQESFFIFTNDFKTISRKSRLNFYEFLFFLYEKKIFKSN